jgi:hypothetical protein
MESDSGRRAKESGVRRRRYSIRYPFAADAEMLELESGSRATRVTSDLSLGGCFVGARCTLEMLTVVRVLIPNVGMDVEFLDIDPDCNSILLSGSKIFANRTETCRHIGRSVSHDLRGSTSEAPTRPQSLRFESLNHSTTFFDDRPRCVSSS